MTTQQIERLDAATSSMKDAIINLVYVHGVNNRLYLGAGAELENNEGPLTFEFVNGGNCVSDLIATRVTVNDTGAVAECYDCFTKKTIEVNLEEFDLYNLERIMKSIL